MHSRLAHTYVEAAARLNVSKRHVERLVSTGKLLRIDVGGAPRIRVADLEEYVASLAPARRDFRAGIVAKRTS